MRMNLARSLLLMTLAFVNVEAQQADTEAAEASARAAEMDALEPGVSSSALASGAEVVQEAGDSDSAEALEPAEPGAVLAQDVRRRESSSGVMDEIDLARTEITGNQELPKVLYIVPWQKSDPGQLTGKPVNSLLDEVLAPIDRTEFIRQVDYFGDLNSDESSNENE